MKRLSITVRLTLLFILLLSVAGAGIVWTLYNGLASELKWRDDTTLINRTAQIKQLLIDGVNPDTLPVYFNRMMDVSQDILIWICPYISRHLLSLNPLQARCRRYSRGER